MLDCNMFNEFNFFFFLRSRMSGLAYDSANEWDWDCCKDITYCDFYIYISGKIVALL